MSGIHELRGAVQGKGYSLVRPLTEGASAVFQAKHERIAGVFVVRLFPPEISARSEAALRIQSGVRLASVLRHPGIVQVLDFNVSGEEPAFVIMEHVPGRSLDEVMIADGMLPLPVVVDLMEQLAAALQAAHALGITHGDLNPASIRLAKYPSQARQDDRQDAGQGGGQGGGQDTRRMLSKILGFGWAKELRASGRMRGRSVYVAPEQQSEGPKSIDARADQFSLAAIVYEMLAACSPFSEESSDLADPEARRYRQPQPLAGLVVGLPAGLDEVLRRALSYDPQQRFPRLEDFASALSRVAAGQTPTANPPKATWDWPPPISSEIAAGTANGDSASLPWFTASQKESDSESQKREGQQDVIVQNVSGSTENVLSSDLLADHHSPSVQDADQLTPPLIAASGELEGNPTPPLILVAPEPRTPQDDQLTPAPVAAYVLSKLMDDELTPPPISAALLLRPDEGEPTPPPVFSAAASKAPQVELEPTPEPKRDPTPESKPDQAQESAISAFAAVSPAAGVDLFLAGGLESTAATPENSSPAAVDAVSAYLSSNGSASSPVVDAVGASSQEAEASSSGSLDSTVLSTDVSTGSQMSPQVSQGWEDPSLAPPEAPLVSVSSAVVGETGFVTGSPPVADSLAPLATPWPSIGDPTPPPLAAAPSVAASTEPWTSSFDAGPTPTPVTLESLDLLMGLKKPVATAPIPILLAKPRPQTRLLFGAAALVVVVGAVIVMSGMRSKAPDAQQAGAATAPQIHSSGTAPPAEIPGPVQPAAAAPTAARTVEAVPPPAVTPTPARPVAVGSSSIASDNHSDRTRPHRGRVRHGSASRGASGHRAH